MKARDIPNLICIVRMFLVFPIVIALLTERFGWALSLFVIAGLSDGLDGYLAKHYGWVTRLGSLLDPLADKLLQISVSVACGWLGLIPAWLVALVILRDLVIVTGAIIYHNKFGPFEGEPLISSKLNTVMQLGLLTIVMVNKAILPVAEPMIHVLIFFVVVTTLWSGASYVYEWGRRTKEQNREHQI